MRILLEQRDGTHHHSRGAEAALEPMFFDEAFLDRMELAIRLKAFDRPHLSAVRLDREDRAGFHRLAVEEDRARSAVRRVAANVRSGQAEVLSEEMDKQGARLYRGRPRGAVHGHVDVNERSGFFVASAGHLGEDHLMHPHVPEPRPDATPEASGRGPSHVCTRRDPVGPTQGS